ncbi:MAG: NAD(P)/FAD-dependent oxidoreductase [Bacteroidales bacterium]|nr:NAD(P)/FAD-dependent oxidoreductase [Bacteroidales bacterium]
MAKRAVIIGSGLGGLECALILARRGYAVTVLEKHPTRAGGCLQSFERRRSLFPTSPSSCPTRSGICRFDTGVHYVGGLGEGESLHTLFAEFGLLDLPWKQINPDCVDEIVLDGKAYPLASGYRNFVDRLAAIFPTEREGLERFVAALRDVGSHIFDAVGPGNEGPNPLFSRSAYEFLQETIHDDTLRRVLSGAFMRMELAADTLPLYNFAQINNSFVQSAWKLEGGGQQIADRLVEQIEALGGRVILGAEVTGIDVVDGRVVGVRAKGPRIGSGVTVLRQAQQPSLPATTGNLITADIVVSDIHPAATLALVGDEAGVRKAYRSRICSLPCSFGVFTANIALKKGIIPARDGNIYAYAPGADPWHPAAEGTDRVMIYFYPSEDGFADRLDLIAPMAYQAAGSVYEAAKEAKLREVLALAETALPGLSGAVENVWTSTPLTWEHFTGTPGGSAFGIRKDWRNPLGTLIPSRTPVKGLWLTGQNLNLAGLLGVSITSVLTCKMIAEAGD